MSKSTKDNLCHRVHGVNAIQVVEVGVIPAYNRRMIIKLSLAVQTAGWARKRASLVSLFMLGLLAGCSESRKTETTRHLAWEDSARPAAEVRDQVVPAVPAEDVLALVRESPAPEGGGLTQDWVMRTKDPMSQLLFPRWQVVRRGATRYEARFTYTLIDATNQISRLGYTWSVDAALKLVDAPKSFAQVESAPQGGRTLSQQQRRRIQDEESSLE